MSIDKDIKAYIRTVPDFPKPGILFRDITSLFADPSGFRMMLDRLEEVTDGIAIDAIAGIDARGFIVGAGLADRLSKGFVAVRKKGKLPGATISESYALEYGSAELEMHPDAVLPGQHVLLVDDLCATGGTATAAAALLARAGAEVSACAFVVDLPDLGGRSRLQKAGHKVVTLCEFNGS